MYQSLEVAFVCNKFRKARLVPNIPISEGTGQLLVGHNGCKSGKNSKLGQTGLELPTTIAAEIFASTIAIIRAPKPRYFGRYCGKVGKKREIIGR